MQTIPYEYSSEWITFSSTAYVSIGSSAFLNQRFLYIFVCERFKKIDHGLCPPNRFLQNVHRQKDDEIAIQKCGTSVLAHEKCFRDDSCGFFTISIPGKHWHYRFARNDIRCNLAVLLQKNHHWTRNQPRRL